MDARFRIRTREGKELEPRTLEIFQELVRSGVIRPHDLVYDALTGEWAPAEAHPMVRLLRDPLVVDPLARSLEARPSEGARAGGGAGGSVVATGPLEPGGGPAGHGGGPTAPGDGLAASPLDGGETGALQLDLVAEAVPSPEEEARAFIARMEEERRRDPDVPALARDVPLTAHGPRVMEGLVAAAPERLPDRSVGEAAVRPTPPGRRRGRGSGTTLALAGLAALLGVAAVARAGSGPGEGEPGLARGAESPRPSRGVAAREVEVRAGAYATFLAEVEGLRQARGLGEVPPVWLEGLYLADAAAHPEVPAYWDRARAFAQAVRRQEAELYRLAYLEAAERAGVSGPVRSLRLAAALEDFAAGAGAREVVYARMLELADVSLALHEVLVELEGRVTYEPIRGQRVSADPVLEAAGADPEAQALLEVALDRVLRALHGQDGTPLGDRSTVSRWLVEGLGEVG